MLATCWKHKWCQLHCIFLLCFTCLRCDSWPSDLTQSYHVTLSGQTEAPSAGKVLGYGMTCRPAAARDAPLTGKVGVQVTLAPHQGLIWSPASDSCCQRAFRAMTACWLFMGCHVYGFRLPRFKWFCFWQSRPKSDRDILINKVGFIDVPQGYCREALKACPC